MFRTEIEEQIDRAAEAQFWQEYQGKTECFGTVTKLVLLAAIFIQSIVQHLA